MQDYLGHRDPKHTTHYTALPDIVLRGSDDSPTPDELDPKPAAKG